MWIWFLKLVWRLACITADWADARLDDIANARYERRVHELGKQLVSDIETHLSIERGAA